MNFEDKTKVSIGVGFISMCIVLIVCFGSKKEDLLPKINQEVIDTKNQMERIRKRNFERHKSLGDNLIALAEELGRQRSEVERQRKFQLDMFEEIIETLKGRKSVHTTNRRTGQPTRSVVFTNPRSKKERECDQ